MPTTAQSIILRAQVALNDVDGVRWPAAELVRHLNDGQKELIRLRPDQKTATTDTTLASGFRHTLPTTAAALLDITHNSTGTRRHITKIDMVQLDAVEPAWRSRTGASEIVHFMHDLREPRVYFVYPPANNAQVALLHSVYPIDVAAPGGATAAAVTGDIDVPDQWAESMFNFVMFKAFSKDAEFGGNAQMAAGHLGLFNAAIGTQLQSTATVAPQE